MRIVTDNTNNRLQELKGHLLKRKHPEKIIDYSFTKLFQPRKHKNNDKNVITFTRTYSPNHQFSFKKFNNCITNTTNSELQKAFNDKKILFTTRQPKKLRNLLVQAKFETKTIPKSPKLTGLFLCSNCVYHKAGYIIPCSSFSFKLTNGKTITWTYKNYFSCDSKDVIYILICKTCDNFYLGQTQDFKQRTAKHKSDLKTSIIAFAGYAQNTLETVTKLNDISNIPILL